ncbi:hypothetical protein WME91_39195 [Sorangium sp. So ce269]
MRFSEEESVCFMNTLPIAEAYLETAADLLAARSRSARARREAVVTAGSRRAEVGVGRSGGRSRSLRPTAPQLPAPGGATAWTGGVEARYSGRMALRASSALCSLVLAALLVGCADQIRSRPNQGLA